MFLVADTLDSRQKKIRSFLPREPVIAVLLAAADFEWTVRRAVIALGSSSNRHIREKVLNKCSGADRYKKAWTSEVKKRLSKGLDEVVPAWETLITDAYPMRHRVVHGIHGAPDAKKAADATETFLAASMAIHEFALINGEQIFGKRLTVRRKPRS